MAESIQKTFTAVGSDSLVEALDLYAIVKLNKDKVAGLSVIADEMGVFFKKNKSQSGIKREKSEYNLVREGLQPMEPYFFDLFCVLLAFQR